VAIKDELCKSAAQVGFWCHALQVLRKMLILLHHNPRVLAEAAIVAQVHLAKR
jgi:hypothetical protein